MFTLEMLVEFLRDEGFTLEAVDDYDGNPNGPIHRRYSPWAAVGINLDNNRSAAVQWLHDEATLRVWHNIESVEKVVLIAAIPLAQPDCFEQVVANLK